MEFQDPFPKPYVFIVVFTVFQTQVDYPPPPPQACQGERRPEHTGVIHYLSEPWQSCTKAKTRNVELLT